MAVIDSAKVRYLAGTRATMRRSIVESSPLRSATPIPSITVRIVASGGKLAKLSTASATTSVKPSRLSRLATSTTLCVAGFTARTCSAASTALSTATPPANSQNSQNGLGSLLPALSMAATPRNATRRSLDCGSAAVVVIGTSSYGGMFRHRMATGWKIR